MDNDFDHNNIPNPRRGRAIAGSFLLIIGAFLFLHEFSLFFLPDWIFSWPMFLIALGFYVGARHNFRNSSWAIMMVIGLAFLLNDIADFRHHDITWPIIIIGMGLWMILRRNRRWDNKDWKNYGGKWDRDWYKPTPPPEPVVDYTTNTTSESSSSTSSTPPPQPDSGFRATADDYLDAVSVFGGVKKTILSKNFKGGEVVNVFGGAELDFTQANINGQIVIDITQIFGGTKIIVPPHWRVVPDLAAVFASVDDKRIKTSAPVDSDKILILKGVSIFAGVDIRSY